MKKKILGLILLISIALSTIFLFSFTVSASGRGYCGNNLTWTLDDEGTLTISGTGEMRSWEYYFYVPWDDYRKDIKNIIIGDEVTTISSSAFEDCINLETVYFGNSLTSIGWEAFRNCSKLEIINIPSSVTSIGLSSFGNCHRLKNITVDIDNPDYVSDDGILFNKDKTILIKYPPASLMTEYIIPSSVTTIESYAFEESSNLVNITIPDSITSINSRVFENCTRLKALVIPDSVTEISSYAFSRCTGLRTLTIGKNVKSIWTGAFAYLYNLETINWNAENASIYWHSKVDNFSFADAGIYSDGVDVIFGENVRTIPTGIFSPEEISHISDEHDPNIKSVTISSSVKSIGSYAFRQTRSIENVYIQDVYAWMNVSINSNPLSRAKNLYVNNVLTTEIIIPNGIECVNNAFSGFDGINKIIIPNSVKEISENAFYGCSNLTDITVPDSITVVGKNAFYATGYYNDSDNWQNNILYINRILLKAQTTLAGQITVNEGTQIVADDAFNGCVNIAEINLPNTLTYIGNYSFYGCTGLQELTIPDSVINIGEGFSDCYSFYGCTGLKKLSLGKNLIVIAGYAFNNCDSLTEVTIPEKLEYLGHYAFGFCDSLTKLNYNAKVCGFAHVSQRSPFYSSPITTIVIGNTVNSLCYNAFCYSSSLKSIVIPTNLTFIGQNAFGYCSNLTDVYYSGNEEDWAKIDIQEYGNSYLTNATIHYNYLPPVEYEYLPPIMISNGTFNFASGKGSANFDYNDYYFKADSYSYNHNLAKTSMRLALSAYATNNVETQYENAEDLLEKMGFLSIEPNKWYEKEPERNSIGVIAGRKHIVYPDGNYTLIAVAIRGGGYENEWGGNFNVGSDNHHAGFATARDQVIEFIQEYIKTQRIGGNIKLWITGYSRAAATTNLTAAYFDENPYEAGIYVNLSPDNIYAYCFEAPAGVVNPDNESGLYNNIFSIVNQHDFVPMVAMRKWGYDRYGITKYLPSAQTNSDYYGLRNKMLDYFAQYHKSDYIVDDFTYYYTFASKKNLVENGGYGIQGVFLEKMIDKLAENIGDSSNYEKEFQEMFEYIGENVIGLKKIEEMADSLIDEMKERSLLYLAEGTYLINPNIWVFSETAYLTTRSAVKDAFKNIGVAVSSDAVDTLAGLIIDLGVDNFYTLFQNASGIAQGHFPELCMAWLDAIDEDDFSDKRLRTLYLNCPVDMEVYDTNDNLVAAVYDNIPQKINGSAIVSFIDENGQKIVCLPQDEEYRIEVIATDDGEVTYSVQEQDVNTGLTKVINYNNMLVKKDDTLTGTAENLKETEVATYMLSSNNVEVSKAEIIEEAEPIMVETTSAGNGVVSNGGEYYKGEFAEVVATPAENEEFSGWYNGEMLISLDATYRFQVTEAITLTAKFTENTCEIVFLDNEGNLIESERIVKGSMVTIPDAPIKDGYRFDGFYKDKEYKTVITEEDVYTENTTLYAKYTEPSYSNGFYYFINKGNVIITDYDYSIDINETYCSIPAKIGEYPVTEIKDNALSGNFGLETVFVPASVKTIGENVFYGCEDLTIYYEGSEEEWNNILIAENQFISSAKKVFNMELAFRVAYVGYDEYKMYLDIPIQFMNSDVTLYAEVYNYNSETYTTGELYKTYLFNIDKDNIRHSIFEQVYFPADGKDYQVKIYFYNNLEEKREIGQSVTSYFYTSCNPINFNGILIEATSETTAQIVGREQYSYFYIIPSVYEGFTITNIKEGAFEGVMIDEIIIPDSIATIEHNAFRGSQIFYLEYIGTKEQWDEISIGKGNESLENAEHIVYEYNEAVFGDSYIDYRNHEAFLSLMFDCVYKDCVAVIEITDEDGVIEYTTTVDIPNGSNLVQLPVPFEADDLYHEVAINFYNNLTDKIKCGEEWNNYFYATKETYTEGDWIYSFNIDGELEIAGYMGGDTYISIPETLAEKPVEGIGSSAFRGSGIRKIDIPDTVTYVGKNAFLNSSLEEITLPEGLKDIGNRAFLGTRISLIEIPASVEKIGYAVFENCGILTEISVDSENQNYLVIDGNLYSKDKTELVYYLSSNELAQWEIPEFVTKIGDYAFSGNNYIESIIIPEGVKELGNGAFWGTFIETVNIPSTVEKIGIDCFEACGYLLEIKVHADNQYYLDINGVLYNKDKTILLTYPKGKQDAVLNIPEGVTTIGRYALFNSSYIRTLILPSSLTSIEYGAVANMRGLSEVWYKGTEEQLWEINISGNNDINTSYIQHGCADEMLWGRLSQVEYIDGSVKARVDFDYVYEDCIAEFTIYDDWANVKGKITVPVPMMAESIEAEIPLKANNSYYYLEVTYVSAANNTRMDCDGYREFLAERIVHYEGDWVYSVYEGKADITGYTGENSEITVPATIAGYPVAGIGAGAFAGMQFSKITILEGIEYIEESAFVNTQVNEIILPTSLRTVENMAFLYCKITEINLPEGLLEIGENAFKYSMITSIHIPSTVAKIGANPFVFTMVEAITVAEGNENFVAIDGNLYSKDKKRLISYARCNEQKEFIVPDFVEIIGTDAFASSYNLENIELSNGVKEIEYRAFAGIKMGNFFIPQSVEKIHEGAFWSFYVENFTVDENNPYYSSKKGVLFNKEQTTLIAYPVDRTAIGYRVPDGVEVIERNAFSSWELKKIILPKSIKKLNKYCFDENIEYIYYMGTQYEWYEIDGADYYNGYSYSVSYDFKEYRYGVDSQRAYLWAYNGFDEELNIPETIDGNPVYGIQSIRATDFAEFIKTVNIPSCISVIDDYSFCELTGLININVSEENENYTSENGILYSKDKTVLVAYPGGREATEYTIPSHVTTIKAGAFDGCINLETLNIGSNVTLVEDSIWCWDKFAAINVTDDNEYYSSQDGILYNKDKTVLVSYPVGKTNTTFKIPDSVTTINDRAIHDYDITTLIIPKSVTTIGRILDDNLENILYEGTTSEWGNIVNSNDFSSKNIIYGYKTNTVRPGSATRTYENGILTISLNFTSVRLDSIAYVEILNRSTGEIKTSVVEPLEIGTTQKSISIPLPADDNVYSITMYFYNNETDKIQYGTQRSFGTITAKREVLEDGYYKYVNINGNAEIREYTGTETNIVIPETLGGYVVNSIGNKAFESNESIQEIIIPDTVVSIGARAFYGCSSLKNIVIPEGVTSLPDYLFYNCTGLESVTIPNSVSTIGTRAFYGCSKLEKIAIPSGVTTMGDFPFAFCTALGEITVDSGNENFKNDQFGALYIVKENGAILIACPNKDGVTSFSIPEGTTEIRALAFSGCTNYTNITIPKSVRKFDYRLFIGCNNLQKISVHENHTSLYTDNQDVLYGQDILISYPAGKTENEYTVKDGTKTIANYCFYNCTNILKLYLPDSIETINANAFVNCTNLTDVYYSGTEEQWNSINNQSEKLKNVNIIFNYKPRVPGDINGDGLVNVLDITLLRRYNAGGYNVKVDEEAVDVNKDGRVNVLDITLLRRYNAGGYDIELK